MASLNIKIFRVHFKNNGIDLGGWGVAFGGQVTGVAEKGSGWAL